MGKGTEMAKKTDIYTTALMVIIDGIARSDATAEIKQAGAYLAGLVIADSRGKITIDKLKAINSIMEMAAESDETCC
jgi:hypothetical protein